MRTKHIVRDRDMCGEAVRDMKEVMKSNLAVIFVRYLWYHLRSFLVDVSVNSMFKVFGSLNFL